jgi:hypothetical protein
VKNSENVTKSTSADAFTPRARGFPLKIKAFIEFFIAFCKKVVGRD